MNITAGVVSAMWLITGGDRFIPHRIVVSYCGLRK
jgi:hypothetical protein